MGSEYLERLRQARREVDVARTMWPLGEWDLVRELMSREIEAVEREENGGSREEEHGAESQV